MLDKIRERCNYKPVFITAKQLKTARQHEKDRRGRRT